MNYTTYGWHEGVIDMQECPECGQLRPYDWFRKSADKRCWKCRNLHPLKTNTKSCTLSARMAHVSAKELDSRKKKTSATLSDYWIIVDGDVKVTAKIVSELFGITRKRLNAKLPDGGTIDGHQIEFVKKKSA